MYKTNWVKFEFSWLQFYTPQFYFSWVWEILQIDTGQYYFNMAIFFHFLYDSDPIEYQPASSKYWSGFRVIFNYKFQTIYSFFADIRLHKWYFAVWFYLTHVNFDNVNCVWLSFRVATRLLLIDIKLWQDFYWLTSSCHKTCIDRHKVPQDLHWLP